MKQLYIGLEHELIVDNFAGGGGASLGIELAVKRPVDIAVNHDREAIAMHMANHPQTKHYCEDVFSVDPVKATGGKPVGLAWFSPDCTYHSKARGGKPFRDRNKARRKPCHGLDEPLHTITTQGNKHALVSAFLAQHNTGMTGHDARKPLSTITSRGTQQQIVAAHMINLKGSSRRMSAADDPTPTVTAGGYHIGEVRAFLIKYYGTDQDPQLREPMHTVTTKPRFGLVTVKGEDYIIADIGMRMLQPRELYRAQGFPDTYQIDAMVNGKPLTKTAQVRMCGNSVSPVIATALVRANFRHELQNAYQEGVA